MKAPITGVAPPELEEGDAKTIWPTIGALPLSMAVFFWQLMPYICRRYTLTNRRIIIRRGLQPLDEKWVDLDGFDLIEMQVLPGQEWLHAGELIFKLGQSEVLRLSGVSRPEVFRKVCLTAQNAFLSVRGVVQQQAYAET